MPSEAFLNGWFAHKKNVAAHCNPNDPDDQEYSFFQWEAGWVKRHNACKHDGILDYDDIDMSAEILT